MPINFVIVKLSLNIRQLRKKVTSGYVAVTGTMLDVSPFRSSSKYAITAISPAKQPLIEKASVAVKLLEKTSFVLPVKSIINRRPVTIAKLRINVAANGVAPFKPIFSSIGVSPQHERIIASKIKFFIV